MSVNHQICPRCGHPLESDLPGSLCLSCLLAFGLKADEGSERGGTELKEVGDEFARFRIIEKIGEGGCGIVYRAEQLEPIRREVAVKVIKLGMDTQSVIARFEAERQTLALMDHPGIAKVFDAGTSRRGRPFFAMELVAGQRVTDYCDQHQLTIAQRLRLFVQVCEVVQHAHQKGIIHRYLKPSIVFVSERDGSPRPIIIDFGIAKATARQRLGPETIYTAFDQFVGTPAYMSPEQAGLTGEDVDTRSDIYSLGVLLYELLTGRPPFDPESLRRAAVDEICRLIRDEDPERPSTRVTALSPDELTRTALSRRTVPARLQIELRGDLDWIVMKALEKHCARRYDSATSLAADIIHLLNHEPVNARPPSAAYRTQKWVRRHRAVTVSAAVISALLIAGSIISAALAVRARHAEAAERKLRAEAQQAAVEARAEAAAGQHIISLLNSNYSAWRPLAGRRRHTLAWTGVIDELRQQAQTNLDGQDRSAIERLNSLMILADHAFWISEFAASQGMLREALRLSEQLKSRKAPLQAGILECFGLVLRRAGQPEEAYRTFAAALFIRESAQASEPVAIHASYAFAYHCSQARANGDWTRAVDLGQLHLEALRQTYGPTNLAVAHALLDLGQAYAGAGKLSEAGKSYGEALVALRSLPSLSKDPELPEICEDVLMAFETTAAHYRKTGNEAEAQQLVLEGAELVRRLQQPP